MNVEADLQHYLDEMVSMLDHALETTNEQVVKTKITRQADVDQVLIEEYNNGWIDIARLQTLSKLMKDASI